MTRFSKISALALGSSLLAISNASYAQDADDNADAAPVAEEEIVVTGSRVIANGNNSPSPVTIVSTESLLAVQPGANLNDALNTLPVFAGSRGRGSNPTTTGSASGGNGSANQLNLRNLGIVRNLVLMDGLRIPPTLFNGAVDADLVPQMLIKRVDTVTGGVSAVYGSDAVSGVVNFVIDKEFKGLKATASAGISDYSDAETYDAGIAYGADLGDRVHFEASYQYHKDEGVLSRTARPWMNQWGVVGSVPGGGSPGSEGNPYINLNNLRQKDYAFGGRITGGIFSDYVFRSGGVLEPFVHGEATGTGAVEVGGDGAYYDSSLFQPLTSHQVFARADFDVADGISIYAQFGGNFKKNENYQNWPILNNVTLSSSNAFLDPAYQAALANAGEATFRVRQYLDQAPRVSQSSKSDQWVATLGAYGDVGNFDWRLDYVHGRSKLATTLRDNVNRQRLSAALDAVDDGTGNIVCYASTVNSAYSDCAPLNIFGPDGASAEAISYILGDTHYTAVTTSDDIAGQISGPLADLWAGPLVVALSGEWRKVSFSALSDATPDDFADCTDLRYNCSGSTGLWDLTLPSEDTVSQTVWELAGEFNLPLLEDSAIADSLSLNGAARYTHYNTSGNYWTWKLGLDWHLTDTLRLRGTRSRDIRAPNLYELYSERSIVTVTGTDLLTGLSPQISSINGGNPDLNAEIANTITGGIVWQATPELSIALDGYRIKVKGAIQSVNGGQDSFQLACYESGGTSPYCQLQERPGSFTDTSASNAWTAVYNALFNIGEIETYGADLEINYRSTLFNRPMMARLFAAYQPHLYFRQEGVTTNDQAGAAFGPIGFAATPTVRILGLLRFKPSDNLTIDIQEQWRNAMKISGDPAQSWVNNHVDAFGTTGLTLTWEAPSSMGDFEFFTTVQNIFNAHPDGATYSGNGTRAGLRDGYPAGDDIRGRYYSAGVRFKM